MKNLGRYIIPQFFNNSKLVMYPGDNIQYINMNEIAEDLKKFHPEFEIIFKFIESRNNKWCLSIVRTIDGGEDYRYLTWSSYTGEYLGIIKQ